MIQKTARPIGITLLAIGFLWIGGGGTLFFPLILLFPGGLMPLWKTALGPLGPSSAWFSFVAWSLTAIWYLAYVAYLIIGIGLLKLRNWARIGVLVISGLGVLSSVIAGIIVAKYSSPLAVAAGFGTMVPFAWIGWYSLRPGVCYAFGAWRKTLDANGSPVPPPSLSTRARVIIGVLAGASFLGLFVVSLLVGVTGMMRSSDAYRMTLEAGAASPCVANSIGTPIKPGWFVSGNISYTNSDGEADMSIPVRGPRGKGSLDVEAAKSAGIWRLKSLDFEGSEGRMQLIPEPAGSACTIVNPAYK